MKNSGKLLLVLFFGAACLSVVHAQPHPPGSGQAPAGQTVLGVILPSGAVLMQKTAGSRTYRIPDEIKNVEQFFRSNFSSVKDITITARTAGDVRVIIFEDKGQRAWSTIQLSGVVGGKICYVVMNTDTPSAIDEHR